MEGEVEEERWREKWREKGEVREVEGERWRERWSERQQGPLALLHIPFHDTHSITLHLSVCGRVHINMGVNILTQVIGKP